MEILNGVFFNNEDFATLTELAERDDKTIKQLRKEISELEATLESVRNDRTAWREEAVNAKNALDKANRELKVTQSNLRQVLDNNTYWINKNAGIEKELAETKAKLEVSIKLSTLFMVAAAKE